MAPATFTCRHSPWSLAPTHHCGRTTPSQTPPQTSPCFLLTLNSCTQWENSGKPATCMPNVSPPGSSWSVWPWGCVRRWSPTVSGHFPSVWMSSQSVIITTTTSYPINGSTQCPRSSSNSGNCTKVALCVWEWDAVPLRGGGVRGGAVSRKSLRCRNHMEMFGKWSGRKMWGQKRGEDTYFLYLCPYALLQSPN